MGSIGRPCGLFALSKFSDEDITSRSVRDIGEMNDAAHNSKLDLRFALAERNAGQSHNSI
jgi:hypothetical protein